MIAHPKREPPRSWKENINPNERKNMNNTLHELAKRMTTFATIRPTTKTFSHGLTQLINPSVIIPADDTQDHGSTRIPVTGNFDWSIVPAALAPPFVFVGTDGDFYVR